MKGSLPIEDYTGDCAVSSAEVAEKTESHGALLLVLGYLRLPELLALQMVCRLLRDAIATDLLLWRHLAVAPPLSAKLTDDVLLRLTSRAEGKLESLALFDCWKISDAGLMQVAEQNPGIAKLFVPGCTYLTPDGMVRVVRLLTEHKGNLKHLRLYGLSNITNEHLEIFKSLLFGNSTQQDSEPCFYSYRYSLPLSNSGSRPIDVDICPTCKNVGMVFDCTREDCRSMKNRWTECRGCYFCVTRCENCGGCIDFDELGPDTVCSHLLCVDCWLHRPKCNMCNRPYCNRHSDIQEVFPVSHGFVCEQCKEFENSSTAATLGYLC